MPVVVTCPTCGARVRMAAAGKVARCPRCKEPLKAPQSAFAVGPTPERPQPMVAPPALEARLPRPGFPWLPVVLISAPVVLLLVGGAAFLIGLLVSRPPPTPALSVAPTSSQPVIPPPAPPPGPAPAPSPAPAPAKEQTEFDASRGAAPFRYARIGVNVAVDHIPVRDDILGTVNNSPEPHLLAAIRITNTSQVRTIHYDGWSDGFNTAVVHDEFGNTLRKIDFGFGSHAVGQIQQATIPPGQFVDDLIVFEAPLAQARTFTLKLPLRQLDLDGDDTEDLTFVIPASMFRR